MHFKRIWVMFNARNAEFFRDRSAFGWNFVFPFLLVGGFALIFGGEGHSEYKVGIVKAKRSATIMESGDMPLDFLRLEYIQWVPFESAAKAIDRLKHHKIDLLIKPGSPHQYWVNRSSPKGYFLEKVLLGSLVRGPTAAKAVKQEVEGAGIRYIDWFFPGILAMNMMFSALWGVGYIVVRYRKNGVLKRLKATPLTAFEYLSAQALSRIFLLMFTLVVVWIGCDLVFDFRVEGSYVNVFLSFLIGGISVTALGLLIASRGTSEEFTSGILNFITWPMMFLSEVWFSLEGAPQWLKLFAKIFPLTQMLSAVRKVMNDGAGLVDIRVELLLLCLMTAVFLSAGALLFSWNR